IDCESGLGSVPLLRGCSARFQCRTAFRYDGGDHVIFVGQVLAFDETDLPPLAFHRGSYGTVTRPATESDPGASGGEGSDGSLSSDFLGTLLATAHSGVMGQVRRELTRLRLLEAHHQVLVMLKAENGLSLGELDRRARLSDQRVTYQTLADLSLRGLVSVGGPDDPATRVHLTAQGDETAIRLGAALKAAEADAERLIGASDSQALKMLLKGVIRASRGI
ncbi:MAG: flavin reductase family protein, partial [Steroidobacteraceae bacterium]